MLNQVSRTQLLLGKESIAGRLIAGEVVKDLTSMENEKENRRA